MVKLLSVNNLDTVDSELMKSLKNYGFVVGSEQRNLDIVLPECPVRPGTLLKANNKPWMYFTTIVKLRRHYMNVYRDYSNTSWEYSEDMKQVTIAINLLNALSYHMAEKIVLLLARPAGKGAVANDLSPELQQYISILSYSPDPSDTCLKITCICNETYGVRFIRCVDALVNNHLDVYAKFSTVT